MAKHRERVTREVWFSKENFERPGSVGSVESALRSDHDIQGFVDTEVTEQMSGDIRVEASGLIEDVEGDPE